MEDRSISVRGIIYHGTQLLVEWLAFRDVCFPPGGRAHEGESLEKTLQRELREEIGLTLSESGRERRYLGTILSRWREGSTVHEVKNHYFLIHFPHQNGTLCPREAGREFRWIELYSLEFDRLVPASLRGLLPDILAGPDNPAERLPPIWNSVDDEL